MNFRSPPATRLVARGISPANPNIIAPSAPTKDGKNYVNVTPVSINFSNRSSPSASIDEALLIKYKLTSPSFTPFYDTSKVSQRTQEAEARIASQLCLNGTRFGSHFVNSQQFSTAPPLNQLQVGPAAIISEGLRIDSTFDQQQVGLAATQHNDTHFGLV